MIFKFDGIDSGHKEKEINKEENSSELLKILKEIDKEEFILTVPIITEEGDNERRI